MPFILYLSYNYALYIHDDRRMLMSCYFFDFYFGWIHIERQVEVRLMRLHITEIHDAVERVASGFLVVH